MVAPLSSRASLKRLKRRVGDRLAETVLRRHGGHAPPDTRHTYGALGVLADRYGWRAGSLSAAELRVFSQNGEDGVVAEIFSRIGVAHAWFVEFGIETGIEGNAVLLADVLGWRGLFMEGDDASFAELRRKYANNDRVRTRHVLVTPENLEQLLREEGVPEDLDLLSIDVDGEDYFLWSALDTYRPRLVVVEYNSALPRGDRKVVRPDADGNRHWRGFDHFGSSLGALEAVASEKGYVLVHLEMAGVNAFFVRDDLVERMGELSTIGRSPNYGLSGRGHAVDPEPPGYDEV